ncbi:hypothetical protein EYF80_052951 [Liparis tanakae]|uniref:Uncharacterized protein n=1 Tax=Liparis tanakae TaxID=230148 RepID=A0A4Z2F7A2_9TELE|nr:hypothetical protein EYF80_052951 [Liparis tanakae]
MVSRSFELTPDRKRCSAHRALKLPGAGPGGAPAAGTFCSGTAAAPGTRRAAVGTTQPGRDRAPPRECSINEATARPAPVFIRHLGRQIPKSSTTPSAALSANGVPPEAVDYDRLKQVRGAVEGRGLCFLQLPYANEAVSDLPVQDEAIREELGKSSTA